MNHEAIVAAIENHFTGGRMVLTPSQFRDFVMVFGHGQEKEIPKDQRKLI